MILETFFMTPAFRPLGHMRETELSLLQKSVLLYSDSTILRAIWTLWVPWELLSSFNQSITKSCQFSLQNITLFHFNFHFQGCHHSQRKKSLVWTTLKAFFFVFGISASGLFPLQSILHQSIRWILLKNWLYLDLILPSSTETNNIFHWYILRKYFH